MVRVEEFPEIGKAVIWKTNRYSGVMKCKIKNIKNVELP
jgi:hypothetical protein